MRKVIFLSLLASSLPSFHSKFEVFSFHNDGRKRKATSSGPVMAGYQLFCLFNLQSISFTPFRHSIHLTPVTRCFRDGLQHVPVPTTTRLERAPVLGQIS